MAISLEKLEKEAPQLINLAKKAEISLKKANLTNHHAKVALCLDISASMSNLYRSGVIQQFAEKILALGSRFDDDGAIEIFLFGADAYHAGDMNLKNFQDFVATMQRRFPLEGNTLYGKAIKMIREFYFTNTETNQSRGLFSKLLGGGASSGQRSEPVMSSEPVYVMFVTDGATADRAEAERQISWASYEPIFWQFMAIGAGGFDFLEQLDNLRDRYTDNADFFSVANPATISDDKLYDLLMTEYPNWIQRAKAKNLLTP
jgi:hypothetical protein